MIALITKLIIILISIDTSFIFFILLRKIYKAIYDNYKAKTKNRIEKLLQKCFEENDASVIIQCNLSRIEKLVLEELVTELYSTLTKEKTIILNHFIQHYSFIEKQLRILNKRFWWEQANAAYILGVLKVERSVPMLLKRLQTSKNREVQFKCGEAILKISGSKHLEKVVKVLIKLNERDHKQLINLIVQIDEDYFDNIIDIMREGDTKHIKMCIEILGEKKDDRVLPLLKECFENSDQEVIIAALKASERLGYIDDEEYINILYELKNHKNWAIRSFLAKVFKHFYDFRSYEALSELIQDTKWRVRYNAGISLSKMGAKGFFYLSNVLFCDDRYAQEMAWQLLQKEKDINLFQSFNKNGIFLKLRVEQNMLRYMVFNLKDKEKAYKPKDNEFKSEEYSQYVDLVVGLENSLYNILNNEEHGLIAIEISGEKEEVQILSIIKKCLKDRDQEVIISALKAGIRIGYINDEEYLNILLRLNSHKNWKIRSNLAILLRHFSDSKVYTYLKELMQDPVRTVRNNSGESLSKMGAKGFFHISEVLFCDDRYAKETAWQLLLKEKEINLFQSFNKDEMYLKIRVEQNMLRYMALDLKGKEKVYALEMTGLNGEEYGQNVDLIVGIGNDFYDIHNNEKDGMITVEIAGERREVQIVPIIKKCLTDKNQAIIISALKAGSHIGYVNDHEYLDILLNLSTHSNWIIRNNLAILLRYFNESQTHSCLMELMKDPVNIVRKNCSDSLKEMGAKGFFCLSKVLFCEDRFARELAWELLQEEKDSNNFNSIKGENTEIKTHIQMNMLRYLINREVGINHAI